MAFFKTLTGDTEQHKAQQQAKLKDPRWGSWEYDPATRALLLKEHNYGLPLEEITDSGELVDWIFQIRAKDWATPQILADLLEALEFILAPRAHYGSQGMTQPFDVKTHLERLN